MSTIREYFFASLLCLLLSSPLTFAPAKANRTTRSDLQPRGTGTNIMVAGLTSLLVPVNTNYDPGFFGEIIGELGNTCVELLDSSYQTVYWKTGTTTETEKEEDGAWDLCYMPGDYEWTRDDSEVTNCLIDLHSRQDSACISVEGSPCEEVKGETKIVNAEMKMGLFESDQVSSSASIAMQAASDAMIGMKVENCDVELHPFGNVFLGRRESEGSDDFKLYVTFEGQEDKKC